MEKGGAVVNVESERTRLIGDVHGQVGDYVAFLTHGGRLETTVQLGDLVSCRFVF
jgi:hypothetical protein